MAFTDDKLQQAESSWEDRDYSYRVDGGFLIDLLSRLRAAEEWAKTYKAVEHGEDNNCYCCAQFMIAYEEAEKRWLRAAGKSQ